MRRLMERARLYAAFSLYVALAAAAACGAPTLGAGGRGSGVADESVWINERGGGFVWGGGFG
jgi:hypothetical protein